MLPGESKRCLSTTDLGPVVMRKEFLQAEFADREVSQLLIGERYLHLPAARLKARMVDGAVEISTNAFARQVTLTSDAGTAAIFEDNYFDMTPNQTKTVAMIDSSDAHEISIRALNAAAVILELE